MNMEKNGFTFKDDMTMRRFYEIAAEKDVAVQMREIAAELSALGRAEFLAQLEQRPNIEAVATIAAVFFDYMKRMREGGEQVARDLATHAGS